MTSAKRVVKHAWLAEQLSVPSIAEALQTLVAERIVWPLREGEVLLCDVVVPLPGGATT
jgi:hypothetical protein